MGYSTGYRRAHRPFVESTAIGKGTWLGQMDGEQMTREHDPALSIDAIMHPAMSEFAAEFEHHCTIAYEAAYSMANLLQISKLYGLSPSESSDVSGSVDPDD